MYIKKVTLENIRGFEKLELDLTRPDGSFAGWTVFTGGNGAGKSTLLKAIAINLVDFSLVRSLQQNFNGWYHENSHTDKAEILTSVLPDKNRDLITEGSEKFYEACYIITQLVKRNNTTTIGLQQSKGYPSAMANDVGPKIPPKGGWFACGYGPFRRVFGASVEATRLMTSPVVERFVTMFQEAASLFEVSQWLRDLNYKALEGKTEEKAQLEMVLEILRDDLLPNQITVDRVDSDGLWLKDRNGIQLTWGDMSDGYRSVVALLADILRHMINAFGMQDLTDRGPDGRLFIKPPGIVMIDEVDAHLHPEWQREIGFWLKKHFPNIQFLVTTHSPLICQAADTNGLFVLPEPGSNESARAYA